MRTGGRDEHIEKEGELVVMTRSLQCPPNSCRNLVIPAESGGFQRNDFWQEGLLFSSFRCLIIPAEFGHSGDMDENISPVENPIFAILTKIHV